MNSPGALSHFVKAALHSSQSSLLRWSCRASVPDPTMLKILTPWVASPRLHRWQITLNLRRERSRETAPGTAPRSKNDNAPRQLTSAERWSCPSWARTRTLLIQNPAWRPHNSGKLTPNHKLRVSVCRQRHATAREHRDRCGKPVERVCCARMAIMQQPVRPCMPRTLALYTEPHGSVFNDPT